MSFFFPLNALSPPFSVFSQPLWWYLCCPSCNISLSVHHLFYRPHKLLPQLQTDTTEHTPGLEVCNKVNCMHLLCESPNWGNPRGKQKVSMLKIKVRSTTPRHISHPVTRAFLIDVTISNVTVPVNHTEVLEHWLFFTQDASVSFSGELYKGQTVSPHHTLGQDSTRRPFAQSWFVNLKENSGALWFCIWASKWLSLMKCFAPGPVNKW